MWLMTVHGFVPLVEDRDDPNVLQARARVPEDIQATLPDAQVFTSSGGDYRYRARVNRREVADALHAAVMAIDYVSHAKDVAIARSPKNAERYEAYYSCWEALAEMQDYAPYSLTPRPPRTSWEDDWHDEVDV